MLYKPKFLSPSATGDTKFLEKIEDDRFVNYLGHWDAATGVSDYSATTQYDYQDGDYVIVNVNTSSSYKPKSTGGKTSGSGSSWYIDKESISGVTLQKGDIYYYAGSDTWTHIPKINLPAYEFSCICDGNTKVTGGEIVIGQSTTTNSITGYVKIDNSSKIMGKNEYNPSAENLVKVFLPQMIHNIYVDQIVNIAPFDNATYTFSADSNINNRIFYENYQPGRENYYTFKLSLISASKWANSYNGPSPGSSYWNDITYGTIIPMKADIDVTWGTVSGQSGGYLSTVTIENLSSEQSYTGRFFGMGSDVLLVDGFILEIQENVIKENLNNVNQYPTNSDGKYTKFIWKVPAAAYNDTFADDAVPQWYVTLTDGATTVQSGVEQARVIKHPELVIKKEV